MTGTRERIIRAADEVFLQKGFNAVGIDAILRKVGVTKTTFYNHFESKDELVAAVLRWRNALWPRQLKRVIQDRGITDPAARIMVLLEARDEVWDLPAGGTGPFTRAACEYSSGQGPVRLAIAEYADTLHREVLSLAEATGAADPGALTRELKLIIAGVAAMSLVGENGQTLDTAISMMRQAIARHPPKKQRVPDKSSPPARWRRK